MLCLDVVGYVVGKVCVSRSDHFNLGNELISYIVPVSLLISLKFQASSFQTGDKMYGLMFYFREDLSENYLTLELH